MLRFPGFTHDGRVKDSETSMSLKVSEKVVGVERVAGGRIARSQSLASVGAGDSVRLGRPHCHLVVPRRQRQRRLPGLLLLPGPPGTQDQFGRHAAFDASSADLAATRSVAGGDRRFAYQMLRAESRRGRHPSQSHAGSCRSEVAVRPPLGDSAACRVRRVGPAAANDALRWAEDHSRDPQTTVATRRATAFSPRSSQSLVPDDPTTRIIADYPRAAFATTNYPVGKRRRGLGKLT